MLVELVPVAIAGVYEKAYIVCIRIFIHSLGKYSIGKKSMRATDIIRNLLDVIDGVEAANPAPVQQVTVAINTQQEPEAPTVPEPPSDQMARFVQIADLMKNDAQTYANEPSEQVAEINSVTTNAGGGVNGPKHPSDMRSNATSMYPNTQYRGN